MASRKGKPSLIKISEPCISMDDQAAVSRALGSGVLTKGERVEEFEKALAAYVGTKYCVVVSSGTAGLILTLEFGRKVYGKRFNIPAFTFQVIDTIIRRLQANPVYSDVNGWKGTMRSGTACNVAVPTHLYGNMADVPAFNDCADFVVEDCCQALGARVGKKMAGSMGDCGVFSFYPTKIITTGEGGAITTNDSMLACEARALRDASVRGGLNFRMDEMSAALGVSQLKRVTSFLEKREKNAARIMSSVKGVFMHSFPTNDVFNNLTMRVSNRDAFIKRMAKARIECKAYYDYALAPLPHATALAREVVSLPCHPGLCEDDLQRICDEANRALK